MPDDTWPNAIARLAARIEAAEARAEAAEAKVAKVESFLDEWDAGISSWARSALRAALTEPGTT